MPFFSKVGFSFLDLHGSRNLSGRQSVTQLDRAADRILHFLGSVTRLPRSRRTWQG
ncbi:MAG: hypothetical protein MUF72_21040 [Elainella sp. Prado103]|nr:hypothetical protein [Elainella sp. Prado103]